MGSRPRASARPWRCCLAAAAGLALASIAATAVTASAADPRTTLGVYAGSGRADAVGAFEQRLGRPLGFVSEYFSKRSWSELTDVGWSVAQWAPSRDPRRMVYTVPMLPDEGGTLAEGAVGAYNHHFQALAQRLVAAGHGAATLRIGPEFNGSWFRWSMRGPRGGATFAAYWRQIVTTMRSVAGASFKFDWCPNAASSYVGGTQLDAESAWPGDAYVDYVGLDVYDMNWSPAHSDAAARWKEIVTRRNGLRWQRAFAAAHGKQITFGEWGLAHRDDGKGGGDSAYFIERMYEWIRAGDVAYHLYFDFSDGSTDATLFAGRSPKASQRFVALFGNSGAASGQPGDEPRARIDAPAPAPAPAPARLHVEHAEIHRDRQRLHVVASIARGASGSAIVELLAGGRRTRFAVGVGRRRGRISVDRRIASHRQARARSGVVTITYRGDSRTQPAQVSVRAPRRASKPRA